MVLIRLFAVSNHTADMRSICLAKLIAALFDLYWKINAELDGSLFFLAIKSSADSSLMDFVYSPNMIVFFLVENFCRVTLDRVRFCL
jgi:hypothetical protein